MRWIEQDLRHLMALAAGGAVALALFLLMHTFITMHPQAASASPSAMPIGWVTVHHETSVRPKPHSPKKPKLAKQPHTTSVQPRAPHNSIHRPSIHFTRWSTGPENTGPVINSGPQDNPVTSGGRRLGILVRIPPLYPPQAAYRNVMGTVTTCFTVRSDGSVANPRVAGATSAQARRLLGQAALVSILQWKFIPRTVHGHPVATNNVCQDIDFTLNR